MCVLAGEDLAAGGHWPRRGGVDIEQHVERVVDGQGAVVADLQAAGRGAAAVVVEGVDHGAGPGRLYHVAVLRGPIATAVSQHGYI